MSEEIIIDEVNVAECQYFNKVFNEEPYCNIDEEHLYTCSSEPNCYFKQLQRLKQENEFKNELLAKLGCPTTATAKRKVFVLEEQIKQLKQENKRLQMLSCANCGEKYLSPDGAELYEKNVQLKQALEEIRELAEVNSLNTCWTILNNCNDCHDNNECGEQSPIAKLKFIKDKVNEVLNDRD